MSQHDFKAVQNYQNQKGKVKVSTTIHTDTKTVIDNGFTEKTVTKTVTEHYTDGSSSTRKEIQVTREEEVTSEMGGSGIHRPSVGGGGQVPATATVSSLEGQQTNQLRKASQDMQDTVHHITQMPGYLIDPSSPRATLTTENSFIDEALFCHNSHRAKHGAPQLSLSNELCKVAQAWANHLLQLGTMENSHYGYGENIYWSSGPGKNLRGDVPVDYWYNEINHFDWHKMDFQKTTGSFTQIVWKDSKQFGIAKAYDSKGTFIVAFYVPPGNVLGHFKENVQNMGC